MREGRRLADRFLLLQSIGAGGATDVWLARDEQLGERVALRVLRDCAADHWKALRDACRDARRLAHPHVARVFDFYRGEDGAFLCREYVEGASLDGFAEHSTTEGLGHFAQVASALEVAHGLGVVHGDLKTSKILRDGRGNARVIDFRIAAELRTAARLAATDDHLSPQVRAGERPVAADDIYSLGVTIARVMTPAGASREVRDLVAAMSAESRSARPIDLREIVETLTANSSTARSFDAIRSDAPRLRPPPTPITPRIETQSRLERAGASRNRQYAIAAGVLAAAAIVVFVALPRWVESSSAPTPAAESTDAIGAEIARPIEDTALVTASSVQSLLAELTAIRERLEAWAVERWAAVEYRRARDIESRGDAAFIERDYRAAHTEYTEALVMYEAIAARRDAALTAALETGALALEAGDQQGAVEAFDLALAIEPGNPAARAGARRAEGLSALLAHMTAGQAFEADAKLDAARDEFANAVEVDPQYAPAREALERIEAARADRDYESNLSLALVSLANGDLGAARDRFERARSLRPDSPEALDGLRQVQQMESSRAIASLRMRAEAAERAEKWSEAAALYQKIAATQKHLAFAETGLRRNRELAEISGRIAELIDDPTQLFRSETLEEGRDLIERGRRAADGRPKLAEQVRRLELAIQLASTPIPVIFESDTVTEVVIRGVGSLGNFARRDVPLKPGRYVVVGRRNGYRDTRSEISVLPGQQQPVVDVRCTDAI